MKRREAIFNFVVLSAGVIALPSCGQNEVAGIKLKNISLTAGEERLVRRLASLIIPKTDFIGAEEVKATEFTLMMVDDCYPPEKQILFKDSLQQFDTMAKDRFGKPFTECTPQQQHEFLSAMEHKKDIPENVTRFYETTKAFSIQAFTSSKEYLTGVAGYKMVPGSNFKGCVPVKKA